MEDFEYNYFCLEKNRIALELGENEKSIKLDSYFKFFFKKKFTIKEILEAKIVRVHDRTFMVCKKFKNQ